ncbi:MAG: lytic murein transglycosylase B [Candidatus Portiera sp.]|nr:lytic murein transglycosylase B [Portiera sp.]
MTKHFIRPRLSKIGLRRLVKTTNITIAFLAIALFTLPNIVMGMELTRDQEIRKFSQYMQLRHKLDAKKVLRVLQNTKLETQALKILSHTPEQKVTWLEYKKRFINRQHINQGKKFITKHQEVLQRAYQEYGVPPEIITSIIGVETNYGQLYGTYRTINILTTIGFSEYRRAEFFRGELEEFLLLAEHQQKDPFDYVSSYAGAMGYGQFLPSSYRNYGIDFDRDGKVDLTSSLSDAIGSVANYLHAFGWEKDELVILEAETREDARIDKVKFNASLKPNISIRKLITRYGLIPQVSKDYKVWRSKDKVTPLKFVGEEPELWLGRNNYYVLSRYNPSHKYVMALFLLSRALIN